MFLKKELIGWESFVERFGPVFRDGFGDERPTEVFPHTEKGDQRWEDFRKRAVEHVGCNVMYCAFISLAYLIVRDVMWGMASWFARYKKISAVQMRVVLCTCPVHFLAEWVEGNAVFVCMCMDCGILDREVVKDIRVHCLFSVGMDSLFECPKMLSEMLCL